MKALLRLLPWFRELESQVGSAQERALRSEERSRALGDECRWLRDQLAASQQERKEAARDKSLAEQALANFGTQRVFGFKLFPSAQGIPVTPPTDQKPSVLRNERTSDVRNRAIDDFKKQALEQFFPDDSEIEMTGGHV